MYTFDAHKKRIVGVDFVPAGSYGNSLKELRYLIMHYTAGRGFDSTVERFKDPATKASAHLVVGRIGQVAQMVEFDRPAWHAGPDSEWEDINGKGHRVAWKGLNFYSLGIEFDNFGPLTLVGKDFKTWFGKTVDKSDVSEVDPHLPSSFGKRFWHAYSQTQIQVAEDLAACLVSGFGLKDILGHSDVCPGRKQDPGPLFPLAHIRASVLGRVG